VTTPTKYQSVVDTLTDRLITEFEDDIHSIVLFGSVARGEATEDSDIDVLIISEAPLKTTRRIHRLSSRIDLDNDIFTQLVFLTTEGFEKRSRMRSPFSTDLITQGVALYDDGTYERIRREYAPAATRVP